MTQAKQEYDTIAAAYQDSKRLSFRKYVEEYTLFEILGDIRGKDVVDLACGEGFYTRKIKRAGAAQVTGVDISGEMVRLAEEQERRQPLGCKYVHQDVATLRIDRAVDIVVAMYLLNYAQTREQLFRFCQVAAGILRSGGQFAGFNDNIRNPARGTASFAKYGFEKTSVYPPQEGDAIVYRFTNEDGQQFEFNNFFLKPETYQAAFEQAGFVNFRWVTLLHPSQRDNPFWDDFMSNLPLAGFVAVKE